MVWHKLRRLRLPALTLLLCSPHLLAEDTWSRVDTHKRLRQFHDAAVLIEPLCRNKDARACLELAQFYRTGLGVPRDVDKATALLKTSADLGNADAQYQLGVMLANGSGGNRNLPAARHYLQLATAAGNTRAQALLRELPQDSDSLTQSKALAPTPSKPPLSSKQRRQRESHPAIASGSNDESAATDLAATATASGVSALTLAIERGNLALTRQALASAADPWTPDAQGHTPITRAARNNKPELLQYLLAQSNGKGLVAADGRNALFHAVDGNSAESVALLLAAGATATDTDARGISAMQYALNNRSPHAVALLAAIPKSQWQARWLPLAAEHGDQAFCMTLVKGGIALDASDAQSRTALWHAVNTGNAALTQALLQQGADVFAKDRAGNVVLHVAARKKPSPVIELLAPRFAAAKRINITNADGDSALHAAAAAGAATNIDMLLANGADKDLRGGGGNTPLMQAVTAHSVDAARRLIDAGATLNKRNDNKQDALTMAQQLGYGDIEALIRERLQKQGVMSIFR